MKKIQRLLAGMLLLSVPSISQTVMAHSWAKDIGSNMTADETKGMITSGGYTYVTGYFQGTMSVPTTSGTYTLTSAGGKDVFVAKYDANTGSCVAVTSWGGPYDDIGKGITVLGANIYFAGSNENDQYMLIGKLPTSFSNGTAPNINTLAGVNANAITNDGTDLYITGMLYGGAIFPTSASTSITHYTNAASGLDVFVAKLSPSNFTGSVLYFTNAVIPYNTVNEAVANSIAVYNGHLYITGYYRNTLQFTPNVSSQITTTQPSDYNIFLSALNCGTLNFLDQVRKGGSNYVSSSPWNDCGYGVAANANGIFVCGSLYLQQFYPGFFDTKIVPASSLGATYSVLVKYPYDPNITGAPAAAAWVDYAEVSGMARSYAYGVALTYDKVVMVGGRTIGNTTFRGQNSTSVSITSTSMAYAAVFNQVSGNAISATAPSMIYSTIVTSAANAVTADPLCDKFQYGGSQDDASRFGNVSTSFTGTAGTGFDAFIASASSTLQMTANTNVCTSSNFQLNSMFTATGHCFTTFSWSPASNLSCTSCTSPIFNTPTNGNTTYSLTVTSCNGCSYSGPVTLNSTTGAVANAGIDKKICPGLTTTTIGVNTSGITSYSWAPANGLSCTTCATPTCSTIGTYTLTTTSACGVTTDIVNVTAELQQNCNGSGRIGQFDSIAPSGFTLYPNPGSGQFQLSFVTDEVHTVNVYNTMGQLIHSQTINGLTGEIQLETREPGIYLVKVTDSQGETVSNMIIE